MLIGHLPAGFLAARGLRARGALLVGLLAGSVLPDIDMLWFHFVDHGAYHHHSYLTHRPVIWAVVLLASVALRNPLATGIGLGALLHMCLDSIAGSIAWGWPLTAHPFALVTVPATQAHWILSYVVHWTFALELAVVVLALGLLVRDLARRRRA